MNSSLIIIILLIFLNSRLTRSEDCNSNGQSYCPIGTNVLTHSIKINYLESNESINFDLSSKNQDENDFMSKKNLIGPIRKSCIFNETLTLDFEYSCFKAEIRFKRQTNRKRISQIGEAQKLALLFNPFYIRSMQEHGSIRNNPKMQRVLHNRFQTINPLLAEDFLNYDKIHDDIQNKIKNKDKKF
ncbi:unnamed protein product [Brachionus calyciflorus]|uniref:Uncharacterized protein n=1 Tax=Brachionus calyciflorus TaxID=104777 RepID=A0A813Y8Q2_9BILA|nr:unnamed protein product [Brachionus calyciflorus]